MMHFGCKVVSGIFTNKKSQDIAKSLGLTQLYVKNQVEWASQNNVIISENILDENSTASVMACQINH